VTATTGPAGLGSKNGGTADPRIAAQAVSSVLAEALGPELVAVYLHGSAVLGGFRWDRSDLDVLVLSRGPLSDAQLARAATDLAAVHYPANGLELSVVTADEAASPQLPAPRFQLHVTSPGWDRTGTVVDGRPRDGDPDLVLHLEVCREAGETVRGPSPRETICAVPHESLARAVVDEVRWARTHTPPPEYLVLTAARAWLFSQTGQLVSKVAAGEWAVGRWQDRAVIDAALARQGGGESAVPAAAADRFADHVERQLVAQR
jgi:Aminoglycoside adenylyltransferase, C-terminal domain